jgi:hypothetical protein
LRLSKKQNTPAPLALRSDVIQSLRPWQPLPRFPGCAMVEAPSWPLVAVLAVLAVLAALPAPVA